MNRSLFIHNVQRDLAVHLCIFYKRIIWVSKSLYHHLQFTPQLCHLSSGMGHLRFPKLVLVLMHLNSDNHSKVNVMSGELTGLRVFANCITTKPSLRQRTRRSSERKEELFLSAVAGTHDNVRTTCLHHRLLNSQLGVPRNLVLLFSNRQLPKALRLCRDLGGAEHKGSQESLLEMHKPDTCTLQSCKGP